MVTWHTGDIIRIKLPSVVLSTYPEHSDFVCDSYNGGDVDSPTSYDQSVFNNSYGYTIAMLNMALTPVIVELTDRQAKHLNTESSLTINSYTFHSRWLELDFSLTESLKNESIMANILIDG